MKKETLNKLGFWVMVVLWLLPSAVPDMTFTVIYAWVILASAVLTFVTGIMLRKSNFGVMSLILSTMFLTLFLLGFFFLGVGNGL